MSNWFCPILGFLSAAVFWKLSMPVTMYTATACALATVLLTLRRMRRLNETIYVAKAATLLSEMDSGRSLDEAKQEAFRAQVEAFATTMPFRSALTLFLFHMLNVVMVIIAIALWILRDV